MRILFWTKVAAVALLILIATSMLIAVAQEPNSQATPAPPWPKRIEPPSPDATAADLERRGDELRAEKAYLDAVDYYHAALKKLPKGPQSSMVLNKIGIAQFQMERYKDAKKSYEKSIKYDKTSSYPYNNLGVVFYRDKKYGRAAKYYKKAILLDPDNASFHNNLAAAYFADKKLHLAIPEYLKALELDPNIFERRSTTGVVAQISPGDRAHYYYVLAKIYAQAGQFDRALLYLRRAIEEGYPNVDNALHDAEFAQLRKDHRFTELMTTRRPEAIP